ncbi:molybdopterin-dependent oxidoreductase [bacterium]|nr:molybdopterin-dependent oxidoreductase [bacterium]
MTDYKTVGTSVPKMDSLALATGREKFVDDYDLGPVLYLALLYSPHAFARIVSLDESEARSLPGVVDIYSYQNVPAVLHTTAGQGYPEPSPYDNVLFDDTVRFVGDRVAMVAAENQATALRALDLIKVDYEVFEPLFDPEKAQEPGAPRIARPDVYAPLPVAYRPEQNVAAEVMIDIGNCEQGFAQADHIEEHVYRTQYASHCALEPHAAAAYYDERGRLVILSTTQVPFHARRIVSMVLGIPIRHIRVIKPRIGGGFGGKQEVFLELLVALCTSRTKRSSKIVLNRGEVFVSSRTRHPMRIRLKTGFKDDGTITALEMDALMNTGAYGSHALTVLSNAGSKVLPLFNKIQNISFLGRSVYTNLPVGGAYRGYGATQSYFGYNQQIDMIARRSGQDVLDYISHWHIKTGETSPIFEVLGEGKEGVSQYIKSAQLGPCLERGAREIGWSAKRGRRIRNGDWVKGVGVAVAMQGSGIPRVDLAAVSMKMNEDGSFNMLMGATDIGTGSDTVLAQIAAEVLHVPVGNMIVLSSDTDLTPFDVGAYASSTTYVSGNAVKRCAEKIRDQILEVAAVLLKSDPGGLELTEAAVRDRSSGRETSYAEICRQALYVADQFQIQAEASYYGTESPPPFIAQFAEVDVDIRTGVLAVREFVSVVDCGQPINPRLAEGQVEGAVVNGLSYALVEEYLFNESGRMTNPTFWDYKIYGVRDLPRLKTIIVSSNEETGPFGAKSVGEIAINGPLPAIANAVFDATGVRLFEAPFTREKVFRRFQEEGLQ